MVYISGVSNEQIDVCSEVDMVSPYSEEVEKLYMQAEVVLKREIAQRASR